MASWGPGRLRLVIVGGGTAGWLTAGVLAASVGHRCEVTLVESPTLPTLGVGEGTWPTMRDTLRRIGLRETDVLRGCDAAFKQGSRFDGWVDGGAGDSYFHPFTLPHGHGEADLVGAWCHHHPGQRFDHLVGAQPQVCARGLAPKQTATPEYASVLNYGYHLDATRFAGLLCSHAVARLGVRHLRDEVLAVQSHPDGDIAGLRLAAHGLLEGDLFVDCSGSASILLGGHFGVPFVSQRHALFCDRALAVQVPYPATDAPIACQTIATAQSTGWVWDIGLPTRRGVGLVYSSDHCSDDEAERLLRAHLARSGTPLEALAPRALRFTPGHRAVCWQRNALAIGQAAGFVEPLEASAIALVEFAAGLLAEQLPATREVADIVARRFNEACLHRWARIVEFLKLHYVLSRRDDSDFWRDHRRAETVPERLRELLALWREQSPSRHDFVRTDEPFPSASWQYVLYGMGLRPDRLPPPSPAQRDQAEGWLHEAAERTRRLVAGLPRHRELIDHVHRHGLMPI